MFCVECGRETETYKNGMCINCYIKRKQFTKAPRTLNIYRCPKCLSYKYKGIWLEVTLDEILKRHIKDVFQISKELKKVNIKIKTEPFHVLITGFLEDHEVKEEYSPALNIKGSVCDVCSRKYGGYYEAILQIRANRRKATEEELAIIRSDVEKIVEHLRAKGNRALFITDIAEERGIIDFYISERGSAYTIAKKIQEQYGGEIKQSSKSFGSKDGRQMYRITYLVRLPCYRKGDFISINDLYFYIHSVSGDRIHALDLSNWKELTLHEKEINHATVLGGEELIKEMILVSQSENEVQVMNPKNYKVFELKKPNDASFNKETVKVVFLEDKIFLFPG